MPAYNSDQNAATKNNRVELKTKFDSVRSFLQILVIFGVCFIIVIFSAQIVLKPLTIEGVSMQPTINSEYSSYQNNKKDLIYYFKTNNYSRGDIVIIDNQNEMLIKRVVATGGETIIFRVIPGTEHYEQIGSRTTLVSMEMTISISSNGQTTQLHEDYIKEKMLFNFITPENTNLIGQFDEYKTMDNELKNNYTYSVELPENTFYCLGDNRNSSYDSRCYGYFDLEKIKGEVVLHVPYGKSLFYAIWHKIFG